MRRARRWPSGLIGLLTPCWKHGNGINGREMIEMNSDLIKVFGGIAVLIVFMVWGVNELSNTSCRASTAGMRVAVDYSFFGGCRVQTPDGRMVPLGVYREFKQQPE